MVLINDNNFNIILNEGFNSVENHTFDIIADDQTHFVMCDVVAEVLDGDVVAFNVVCNEEDFYTDFQLDEIDSFLTDKIYKKCTQNL
tara:strand:+ start:317 stop:577 length:261 start_codon:yes stop_codon:yes gene_type:complete